MDRYKHKKWKKSTSLLTTVLKRLMSNSKSFSLPTQKLDDNITEDSLLNQLEDKNKQLAALRKKLAEQSQETSDLQEQFSKKLAKQSQEILDLQEQLSNQEKLTLKAQKKTRNNSEPFKVPHNSPEETHNATEVKVMTINSFLEISDHDTNSSSESDTSSKNPMGSTGSAPPDDASKHSPTRTTGFAPPEDDGNATPEDDGNATPEDDGNAPPEDNGASDYSPSSTRSEPDTPSKIEYCACGHVRTRYCGDNDHNWKNRQCSRKRMARDDGNKKPAKIQRVK